MEFIIPAYYHGKIFTHGELTKLKGGVLADAEKASGDMMGMIKLLSGCLSSVTDGEVTFTGKDIEGVVRNMPYQTAEYLTMKVFADRTEGAIEQIVTCPRCKEKYIYEYVNEDVDNRINFDDLEVNMWDGEDPSILLDLDDSIEITSKGNTIMRVDNLALRFPLMIDGVNAEALYPKDKARRQYQMYVSAITHINGDEVDNKFKKLWGMYIFERMSSDDISKISDILQKYGLCKTLWRTCTECDKYYSFVVDTAGFFD